jgi:hypothetical protein
MTSTVRGVMRVSETSEQRVTVHWYDHDCEWVTKYCDEYHAKYALVPASVLRRYQVSGES